MNTNHYFFSKCGQRTSRQQRVWPFVMKSLDAHGLDQWYSTFFVRVTPDIISLQICSLKVAGA